MSRDAGEKRVLGYREPVLLGPKGSVPRAKYIAKMDTGAKYNRISRAVQKKLGFNDPAQPPRKKIRSAKGHERRDMVRAQLRLAGKSFEVTFSVSDSARDGVLIGRRTLKEGRFLVDSAGTKTTRP